MARKKKKKVNVNLGCNKRPMKGWVNVDLMKYPGVDIATNLEEPWPWEDESVDTLLAVDLIEHIDTSKKFHFMNEAWRVLRVGGILEIKVPDSGGWGADQDPDHKSKWNPNSFLYHKVYKTKEGKWKSHPLRQLYTPDWNRAAFEIAGIRHLEPAPPAPGEDGHFGGISYVHVVLKKQRDPGDCTIEAMGGDTAQA